MSFFSEQESGDLREAKAQIAELISRELTLREENARLKQQVNLLTVRRDQLSAEVKRLEGLILDWDGNFSLYREDALKAEARRIRGLR